jgi:hypothetical protein
MRLRQGDDPMTDLMTWIEPRQMNPGIGKIARMNSQMDKISTRITRLHNRIAALRRIEMGNYDFDDEPLVKARINLKTALAQADELQARIETEIQKVMG